VTRDEAIAATREHIPGFAYEVHPDYKSHKWEWSKEDGQGVPSPKDIMDMADRLLDSCEEQEGDAEWSSGGIEVLLWNDPTWDGDDWVEYWNASLRFVYAVNSFDEP
tara:strand:+ start:143 stop:463 length:321 start_codon:yes stop_codon:yes gene_type:complete